MSDPRRPGLAGRIRSLTGATAQELPALGIAFALFFTLLTGYYVLRSVREALIAADGTRLIPTVFTSVFVAMLLLTPVYGYVVSRWPRRTFLPVVFGAVVAVLVGFSFAFRVERPADWVTTAFAIFLSVMNLFTVSVFWSFMADIFRSEQARRVFAAIGAGGSLGAICGPLLSRLLVQRVGVPDLMLLSAALYAGCIVLILALLPWSRAMAEREGRDEDAEQAIGGSVIAGAKLVFSRPLLFALVLHMFLGVSMGTMLYNQQAGVVQDMALDAASRTEYFATVDLATNLLALTLQVFVTRWLLPRYGAVAVLFVPAVFNVATITCLALGHGLLGADPSGSYTFAAITVSQSAALVALVVVTTRGGTFGLVQAARESLFTRVDRESRYKAKNFIDTVVYRGGDMVTSWSYQGLAALGLSLSALASAWIPVAIAWLLVVAWLARQLRGLPEPGRPSR